MFKCLLVITYGGNGIRRSIGYHKGVGEIRITHQLFTILHHFIKHCHSRTKFLLDVAQEEQRLLWVQLSEARELSGSHIR